MVYVSTKTFPPMSCAFRQHAAQSHCRLIHGYGVTVRVEFEAYELDVRNWVVDFGSLKSFKAMLEDTFDHTLILAEDDPHLAEMQELENTFGVAKIRVLPKVGCEAFAEYIFGAADAWLHSNGYAPRVQVNSVEVSEHQFNSAIYRRSK